MVSLHRTSLITSCALEVTVLNLNDNLNILIMFSVLLKKKTLYLLNGMIKSCKCNSCHWSLLAALDTVRGGRLSGAEEGCAETPAEGTAALATHSIFIPVPPLWSLFLKGPTVLQMWHKTWRKGRPEYRSPAHCFATLDQLLNFSECRIVFGFGFLFFFFFKWFYF